MQFTDSTKENKDRTIVITAVIPWKELEKAQEQALDNISRDYKAEGFRKGKAPRKIVKESVGESKILEEASKKLLTDVYSQLLKKHNIQPYLDPKVDLLKAPKGGSWEIRFTIALAPQIQKLPDYKKIAQELRQEEKKQDIWVPGKDKGEKKQEEKKEQKENRRLQKFISTLIKKTKFVIPQMVIDYELNRRLAALRDEVAKLGMTVDQYLQAKSETTQSLRSKIQQEVIDLYTTEFLLDSIAEKENITVDDKDLEKIFSKAKDEKEKQALKQNSYMYARMLRKQKTLDYLISL